MKRIEARRGKLPMLAAVAGALALSVAACGERQSGDHVGQIPDPDSSTFGAKTDRAADAVEHKADQAGAAIREETAKAGVAVDDAAVTAKVKAALVAEPGLKSLAINVNTFGGVVTLRGTADSQSNRQKAEQLASNVEGVRSVRNELVVVPS